MKQQIDCKANKHCDRAVKKKVVVVVNSSKDELRWDRIADRWNKDGQYYKRKTEEGRNLTDMRNRDREK